MIRVVLQLDKYLDGGMLEAALADLAAAVGGEAVFGLLAGAMVMLTFYIASNGGLATPATLTALTGGVMIAALPVGFRAIGQVVIFLGLVGAVLSVFNKMVAERPPG
jgi:hypothetical protein